MTCLINALWCSIGGAYFIWKNGIVYDQVSDPTEQFFVNFSLGFFVADSIYSTFYNVFAIDQVAHHLGVFIGLGASTTMGLFSSEMVQSLFIAEFSNIFLINRNLLKLHKIESGKLYDFFVVCFIASFFICRSYGMLILMPHLQADPLKPLFLNISSVILFWVTCLWMLQIINLGTKHFAESSPDNKKLQEFYQSLKNLRKPKTKII